MTEKEMKKLNRTELLQLLLVQTKETERLKKDLDKAKKQLADRRLRLEKAGDLAQAVLEINNVAKAAQEAAQQYLDNIVAMDKETQERCGQMLTQAREEAEQIRRTAREDAEQIRQTTLEEAEQIRQTAQKEAEQIRQTAQEAVKPQRSDDDLLAEIYKLLSE